MKRRIIPAMLALNIPVSVGLGIIYPEQPVSALLSMGYFVVSFAVLLMVTSD